MRWYTECTAALLELFIMEVVLISNLKITNIDYLSTFLILLYLSNAVLDIRIIDNTVINIIEAIG